MAMPRLPKASTPMTVGGVTVQNPTAVHCGRMVTCNRRRRGGAEFDIDGNFRSIAHDDPSMAGQSDVAFNGEGPEPPDACFGFASAKRRRTAE